MKTLLRFLLPFVLTALGLFGSVSSQTSRVAYTITVLPAACPTTFPFNRTVTVPDLIVLDGGPANSGNSPPVTLTYNSDYTVTGGGYNSQNQLQLGTVTILAGGTHSVQVGDVITILRNVPFTQTTSFTGFISPLMIEGALDKLTLETQQLKDLLGLSLHFQSNEVLDPLLQLSLRESQSLGFNAQGAIEYSTGGGGGGTQYFAGTGLLLSSNTFSVNPVQTLTDLTVTNTITGNISGNAATAAALQTPRNINGVPFNGTADITVPADAGTLTGTSLPITITAAPGLTTVAGGSFGTMAFQNSNNISVTGGTINGATVTGLATPVGATDAAPKGYVDSVAAGIVVRTGVIAATTANISLSSAPAAVDGVTLNIGNRVLVKDQALPAENGIYSFNSAGLAMARSTDSNTAGELLLGYYYFVSSGSTQGATSWTITTAPTTLGSDPIFFSQFSASQVYAAGTGLSLVGSTFSVNAAQPGITSLGALTGLTVNGTVAGTGFTNYFASPPALGGTAPNTVTATTLRANSRTTLDQGSGSLPGIIDGNPQLRMGNVDSFASVIQADSYSASGLSVLARAAGGTRASPAATFSPQAFINLNAYGYDTALTTVPSAQYSIIAGSLWSAINRETFHQWTGTSVGTTSQAVWMTLDGTGLNLVAGKKLTVPSQAKFAYTISTGAIGAYDSGSGGLYTGYGAGTGIIRSVADNSGAYAPLSIQVGNGTQVGVFTNLGFQGDIGLTTPGHADFIDITWLNNAGLRTTKTNAHLLINVKDYGAIGDGGTNDTTAINAAIAAMTNYSTLYFPAGKYLVTLGSITAFTSLNNFTVCGDGHSSQLFSTATAPSAGFFVFAGSCDHVTIRDLALVGSATSRVSGGHALIVYSPFTQISGIYIKGSSDFGMYIGSGGSLYNSNVQVTNCISDHTLGDGFHFGPVTDSGLYGCISSYTGDDGVGIGDDGGIGFPAMRIEVVGFQSLQAGNHAGGGSNGAGIRLFDGATDIHITGGSIYQSCEAGLTAGRFFTTTAYNTRISVNGLKVYQCLQNIGMYAQVNFQFCDGVNVEGCWSEAPVSQGCYAFLDCNNVTMKGNTAKDAVLRAILTDDSTTANVAATWSNWTIIGNVCLGTPSNESFYFVPASGKTITNLLISGNTETGQSTANYIFTNRLAGTSKIINNISLGGKAIANGGSGIVPTATPNY